MLSRPYRICGSSADSHGIENRVRDRPPTRTPQNSITLAYVIRPDQRAVTSTLPGRSYASLPCSHALGESDIVLGSDCISVTDRVFYGDDLDY